MNRGTSLHVGDKTKANDKQSRKAGNEQPRPKIMFSIYFQGARIDVPFPTLIYDITYLTHVIIDVRTR
jgi:hypothetical protein